MTMRLRWDGPVELRDKEAEELLAWGTASEKTEKQEMAKDQKGWSRAG